MELYHFGSTRGVRALWVMAELGKLNDIETIPIRLSKGEGRTPEHLARHPHGKLPVLMLDETPIIESGAIALHLAQKYGAGSSLLPDPASVRGAEMLSWVFYATTTLDEFAITTFVQRSFFPEEKQDTNLLARHEKDWRTKVEPYLTRSLAGKTWLLGEDFTLADIMVLYAVFVAERMGWCGEEVSAYAERGRNRASFAQAYGG